MARPFFLLTDRFRFMVGEVAGPGRARDAALGRSRPEEAV